MQSINNQSISTQESVELLVVSMCLLKANQCPEQPVVPEVKENG